MNIAHTALFPSIALVKLPDDWSDRQRIADACILALFVVALANISTYVVTMHPRPFAADFYYFYGAGKAWISFASPYSDAFAEVFRNYAQTDPHVAHFDSLRNHDGLDKEFPYPPNSIVLVFWLGLFEPAGASLFWAVMNIIALAYASYAFAKLTQRLNIPLSMFGAIAIHISLISLVWASGEVIMSAGATTFVTYAGALAAIEGACAKSQKKIAIGVLLCLLKPQIGLPIVLILLMRQDCRNAAFIGVAATVALCFIGLIPDAPQSPFLFLESLKAYNAYPENSMLHLSGLSFVIDYFFGIELSSFVLLGLASIATIAITYRHIQNDHLGDATALLRTAMISSIGFLLLFPSHNNYYIMLVPVLLLMKDMSNRMRALTGICLLMNAFAFPVSIALENTGVGYIVYTAAMIDTIAIIALSAAFFFCFGRQDLLSPLPNIRAS